MIAKLNLEYQISIPSRCVRAYAKDGNVLDSYITEAITMLGVAPDEIEISVVSTKREEV